MKLEIGVAPDRLRFLLTDCFGNTQFESVHPLGDDPIDEAVNSFKRIIQMVSGNTVPVEIQEDY